MPLILLSRFWPYALAATTALALVLFVHSCDKDHQATQTLKQTVIQNKLVTDDLQEIHIQTVTRIQTVYKLKEEVAHVAKTEDLATCAPGIVLVLNRMRDPHPQPVEEAK
jgi:hypothetical protein